MTTWAEEFRRPSPRWGSTNIPRYTNRFIYDGWNPVAEVNATGALVRGYLWGNDLSGSMQGAGGIGGLLEVSYYGGSTTTNCFAAHDGNGNVAALINSANGTTVATDQYGLFGEVIRATGPMAKVNPFSLEHQISGRRKRFGLLRGSLFERFNGQYGHPDTPLENEVARTYMGLPTMTQ